ncbi:phosphatidylserine decarboxylase proenzyme [endosymbiont of Sipalinus gigas]|uniref:archaetidylserine decarboxylase n=1 Tax=endosymbiont of Sipalinus gigas TaxID=1972134 RepID=UPI000DC6D35C|nr:archaetidylserine decarboxylase [endosymbiont of Sipalinus gigas]BBA85331.1 phosphatidylserine decarboxylase proenzyme [endosymbiont of Sipalinus gigas]
MFYLKKKINYLFGLISNIRFKFISNIIIFIYIKFYNINLNNLIEKDYKKYNTFNDFFTRKINNINININNNALISPASGTITQLGKIRKLTNFNIKNNTYFIKKLLVNKNFLINLIKNGSFITIYLSPKDYHRVHISYFGKLIYMIYVPGNLTSINNYLNRNYINVITENERVICVFKIKFGYIIHILIGSIIVGSIETSWHGLVIPPRNNKIIVWDYIKYPKNARKIFF